MTPQQNLLSAISCLVDEHLRANGYSGAMVGIDVNLREAGLTSLQLVELVLDVDDRFSLQLDEAAITPDNFRSIATIVSLVEKSRPGAALQA